MGKIKFSVIGCGSRALALVKSLLENKNIELVGVYDPEEKNSKEFLKGAGFENGIIYNDYNELTANPDISWVFIASPNAFHAEHAVSAFKNNKHVFIEKPLSVSIDGCIEMNNAQEESNKLFATGFVLRYAPIYKKVKEILDSGELGKIISIDANENIETGHGAYIMRNWRRHRDIAGSHILEKCVHDFDLINWFVGSVPSKIAAFHGNDMWIKENDGLIDKQHYDNGWQQINEGPENPFTADKDIEDNVVAIMQYYNNTRVQFQATMSNAIPERRMYFSCTKGNLIVELYSATLKYKSVSSPVEQTINFMGDLHGGGDDVIMEELAESMINGTRPKCSGHEGLCSAIVGIKIDEAATTQQMLSLDDTWKQVDVKIN